MLISLKRESITFQTRFYNRLIKSKSEYAKCCPEYIKQAQNFLKTDKDSLKTFQDLNIYPFINNRIINIDYKKKGIKKKVVIYYNGVNN